MTGKLLKHPTQDYWLYLAVHILEVFSLKISANLPGSQHLKEKLVHEKAANYFSEAEGDSEVHDSDIEA